jgi:hypothetical protein
MSSWHKPIRASTADGAERLKTGDRALKLARAYRRYYGRFRGRPGSIPSTP